MTNFNEKFSDLIKINKDIKEKINILYRASVDLQELFDDMKLCLFKCVQDKKINSMSMFWSYNNKIQEILKHNEQEFFHAEQLRNNYFALICSLEIYLKEVSDCVDDDQED